MAGRRTTQSIRDVMTTNPVTVPASATVIEAAKQMKAQDIGDVIVLDDGQLCGVVTDRDIVVRVLADGMDPQRTRLSEVCSRDVATLPSTASVDDAVQIMREWAIRRLPVVDDRRPVGMVSLGDLAIARDSESALADISAAPANQ